MRELGLSLNANKIVPSLLQRTTFLGVAWNSTTMQTRLSPSRIKLILAAEKQDKTGQSLTVKKFQRVLVLMAAASNVIAFGLLYMRPLQWWLKTKRFSPRDNPFCMIKVPVSAFIPWWCEKKIGFYPKGWGVGGTLLLRIVYDWWFPYVISGVCS